MPQPSGNPLPRFVAPERESVPAIDWVAHLRQEQQLRWRHGERPPIESYCKRSPRLRSDPEALLDLIYQEVLLREERGEKPQPREYIERFPFCREQIEQQFIVHNALQSPGLLLAQAPRNAARG